MRFVAQHDKKKEEKRSAEGKVEAIHTRTGCQLDCDFCEFHGILICAYPRGEAVLRLERRSRGGSRA